MSAMYAVTEGSRPMIGERDPSRGCVPMSSARMALGLRPLYFSNTNKRNEQSKIS